jgi:hypothetical protein
MVSGSAGVNAAATFLDRLDLQRDVIEPMRHYAKPPAISRRT